MTSCMIAWLTSNHNTTVDTARLLFDTTIAMETADLAMEHATMRKNRIDEKRPSLVHRPYPSLGVDATLPVQGRPWCATWQRKHIWTGTTSNLCPIFSIDVLGEKLLGNILLEEATVVAMAELSKSNSKCSVFL